MSKSFFINQYFGSIKTLARRSAFKNQRLIINIKRAVIKPWLVAYFIA